MKFQKGLYISFLKQTYSLFLWGEMVLPSLMFTFKLSGGWIFMFHFWVNCCILEITVIATVMLQVCE